MHISIAFACIFKVILIMNGEADTSYFVSMYVYMHLAFKELIFFDLESGESDVRKYCCDPFKKHGRRIHLNLRVASARLTAGHPSLYIQNVCM